MKYILRILILGLAITSFTGCFNDAGTDKMLTHAFLSFSASSLSTSESTGAGTILLEISEAQGSDVDVEFEITAVNAVNGADFVLSTSPVTIPAGEFSVTIPYTVVDNDVFEPDARSFTLTISDVSVSGISMDAINAIKVTLLNDDCEYDADSWIGTFTAYEEYSSSTYGPYDLPLVQDGTDPNKFHMDNFYDSGLDAFIVLDGVTATAEFPDGQSPAGLPITNSSGVFVQCTGEIVIELTFNGDTFVYRMTKQ